MARLYADEDFPYPVVLELRRLGHDVLTVQEAGKAGQKDEAVLDGARTDGRAVLTHNRRDFIHLHYKEPIHAGIVVCRVDLDFKSLAARVDTAIRSEPELAGRLIRINRPSPEGD